MGSVIKKRRKRMARKKHGKLLKKTASNGAQQEVSAPSPGARDGDRIVLISGVGRYPSALRSLHHLRPTRRSTDRRHRHCPKRPPHLTRRSNVRAISRIR